MDAQLKDLLAALRQGNAETIELLEGLDDAALGLPCMPAPRERTVRQVLELLIWHERDHCLQIMKNRHFRTQGINELMGELLAARGMVMGLLLGLSAEELDAVPAEGEWSTHQVVDHLVESERHLVQRALDALPNE